VPSSPAVRPSGPTGALRAVFTLGWTAALVVGIPWALAAFFGWPLPRQMPEWGEVFSTPIQLIDPTVILNFFVCLAWLCWAVLLGYVVLDAVDVARGLGQRVHRLGPLSGVATRLVASAALLVSLARQPATTSFAAKPPTPIAQVVDLPAPPIATPSPPAEAVPATADPPAVAAVPSPTYQVCRGDSLWAIAEKHLGSGFRWKEIYDLNRDQIHDPDYIDIGWTLTLPADAIGLPVAAAVPPLQNAPVEPPVEPEQPAAPTTIPTPTTPMTDSTVAPSTPSTPVATPAPPTVMPSSAPPSEGASPPDPTDVPASTPAPTGRVPVVPGIAGATALASGLLLALLRSRRHRTALAGHRAHRAAHPTDLERAILAAADIPLVRWAGQELAALALAIDDRTFDAGPVAVEFSADVGLEILWDRPVTSEAPRPWEAVPGGWSWRCLYDPDAPVPAPDQPSPIAGLATFGQRDGRQLLVDLESLGTLAVVGDPVRAENFVRSLVLELGANDDLSDAYVFTVEGALDIDGTERFDRVQHATLEDVHGRIAAAANSTRQALDGHASSGFAYQAHGTELVGLEVYVAVARSSPAIEDLIDAAPARSGAVAVILGEADTAATLTIDASGTGRLEPLGLTFDAAGVARDLAAQVAVLLDDTEPTRPSTEARDGTIEAISLRTAATAAATTEVLDADARTENAGPEPEPAPHPTVVDLTDPMPANDRDDEWSLPAVRLLIKVLGTPSIRDRPQLGRRELMVVVYVACMGRPVTQDDVQDAIWGGSPVSEKTVSNLVGHTRSALGDWDGHPILGRVTGGTMQLADGVFTDHQLFEILTDRAQRVSSSRAAPLLHQALDLIDGSPFNADGYEWAYVCQLVADIEARIERATLDLVALELEAGDVEEARRAVMQGLRALPGNEILYRERIRIEEAAGNTKAARSALMELIYYLEDLGTEPSTGTIAQYGHLIGDRQRR